MYVNVCHIFQVSFVTSIPFDHDLALKHHEAGVQRAKDVKPIAFRSVPVKTLYKHKSQPKPPSKQTDITKCTKHPGCVALRTMSACSWLALCASWRELTDESRKVKAAKGVSTSVKAGKHMQLQIQGRPMNVCMKNFTHVTGVRRGPLRLIMKRVGENESVTKDLRGGDRRSNINTKARASFFKYVNSLEREPTHYAAAGVDHTVLKTEWTQKAIVLGWLATQNPAIAEQQKLIMERRATIQQKYNRLTRETVAMLTMDASWSDSVFALPKGTKYLKPPVSPSTLIKWLGELDVSRGKPAVDLCDRCTKYDNVMLTGTTEEKINQALTYKLDHLRLQHMGRLCCRNLIEHATAAHITDRIDVFQSDLGSHIGIPRGNHNSAYYLPQTHTKVWWLTTFALDSKGNPFAYIWPAFQNGQGRNEISSTYMFYLEHQSPSRPMKGKQPGSIASFSDRCGGQELNWTFLSLNMYVVEILQWYRAINQYFFVSGHSYMGGRGPDAIHSQLKRHIQDKPTETFEQIVEYANEVKGVEVKVMKSEDFRNYHKFLEQYYTPPRDNTDTNGTRGKNVDVNGMPTKLSYFTWFNYGVGDLYHKDSDKVVRYKHHGEVWCRRTFDVKETPVPIVLRRKNPKANPKPLSDPVFDMDFHGMKETTLVKILKQKPFMAPKSHESWKRVAELHGWDEAEIKKKMQSKAENKMGDEGADSGSEADDTIAEFVPSRPPGWYDVPNRLIDSEAEVARKSKAIQDAQEETKRQWLLAAPARKERERRKREETVERSRARAAKARALAVKEQAKADRATGRLQPRISTPAVAKRKPSNKKASKATASKKKTRSKEKASKRKSKPVLARKKARKKALTCVGKGVQGGARQRQGSWRRKK